ncbi:MAG TPA: hypothetical protein DD381_05455 [Lentisphaeria bacterium]|nr:MAG: hypothetical protein A2X47_07005 [Lentisphaerae bacterium GWF2_38_69]HBM15777.1 hypothetical protein [Lentisphaeria bacterium]
MTTAISPNYYSIIPAKVRYDKDLKAHEKLLYGEISSLAQKDGICYATNNYFAELYDVDKTTISKWINKLAQKKFIKIKIIYREGTREIINRFCSICFDEKTTPLPIAEINTPIGEITNTPIGEKAKGNNTRKEYIYPEQVRGVCDKFFQEKISIDNARYKNQLLKIKIETWYYAVLKLNTLDGEPVEMIEAILIWSISDSFWGGNVVSLAGLRQKSKNGLSKYFNLKNAWERSKPKKKSNDDNYTVCPVSTVSEPLIPYWEREADHE